MSTLKSLIRPDCSGGGPELDCLGRHGYVGIMRLGEKITGIAADRGLDLKTLAKAADIPYNTLRGYTKTGSTRIPTADVGLRLARALSVPTDWLLDDEQGMPAPPRLESPPYAIVPWPPSGITWDEVRVALAQYLLAVRAHKFRMGDRTYPDDALLEKTLDQLKIPENVHRGLVARPRRKKRHQ